MGQFVVRQVDRESGAELARTTLPNWLAYEGMQNLYHRIFPPLSGVAVFVLGVSGCSLSSEEDRPNPLPVAAPLGRTTEYDDLTSFLCEGGCYSELMQQAMQYEPADVTCSASIQAEGGDIETGEVVFASPHSWSPEPCSHWDNPTTEDVIEPCPAAWAGKRTWDRPAGFPWHVPRRLGQDFGEPGNCSPSYFKRFTGETGCNGIGSPLDWLASDFRRVSGFPINGVYLADSSRFKLIALAAFRRPLLLHPGMGLHVRYCGRIVGIINRHDELGGVITAAFAARFAQRAFTHSGTGYGTIYARPVLLGHPQPSRTLTYDEISGYFDAGFDALALTNWSYVGWPTTANPYVSHSAAWTNNTSPQRTIGPLGALAVFGSVGSDNELMWVTPLATPVSVSPGDVLRVPNGVRFGLRSV